MVAYSYNPGTWEVEIGGLGKQGQPQLHSLGYKKEGTKKMITLF